MKVHDSGLHVTMATPQTDQGGKGPGLPREGSLSARRSTPQRRRPLGLSGRAERLGVLLSRMRGIIGS
ncbi:hypothetical protein GCM10010342_46830 [Streptomyces anulatus]|nr:hypothetical protein GCM10010342_46830 [Streptomyces anulatus]